MEEVTRRRDTMEEGELFEISKEKVTRAASELKLEVKDDLIACLRRNANVFAKDGHNLTRVDLGIMEHHLNITKRVHPNKQRK